jgi:hypothetical protein
MSFFKAALWKSEAEETVKTRKNAMRVIVTKLRNFWPSHDEATLGARACELEGSVYNTTGTKVRVGDCCCTKDDVVLSPLLKPSERAAS